MGSNLKTNSGLARLLEAIAIMTFIATTIFFVLGHLSAYFYFSSFDIPYLKYTDTNTAFDFSLKSIEVFLSIIALFLIVPFILGTISVFRKQHLEKDRTKIRYIAFIFRVFISGLLLVSLIFVSIYYFSNIVTSTDLKERISKKLYIPYEVIFSGDDGSIKCVTTIGSLGEFQVFITQLHQTILIKRSSIISIKKMFAPFPLESLPNGKQPMENPYFEKEFKVWLNKWHEQCPDETPKKYEYFNFSTSGRNLVKR